MRNLTIAQRLTDFPTSRDVASNAVESHFTIVKDNETIDWLMRTHTTTVETQIFTLKHYCGFDTNVNDGVTLAVFEDLLDAVSGHESTGTLRVPKVPEQIFLRSTMVCFLLAYFWV